MVSEKIVCWEPSDVTDPVLRFAERLYEQTLDADERIPWSWIERTVTDPRERRPTGWLKHLVLAAPESELDNPAALAGFAYGALLPGYGGYLSYVGVAEMARKKGVGTRLFDCFSKILMADATLLGEPLPFIIWESYRPTQDDPPAMHKLWQARLKLFDRAGAYWLEGVDFFTPNWAEEEGPAVPLQLFVKPVEESVSAMTPTRMMAVIDGLQQRVYHEAPGDEHYDATFASMTELRLRPTRAATTLPELV